MMKQLILGLCLCLSGIVSAGESKEWATPIASSCNEVVLHVFPMGDGPKNNTSALTREFDTGALTDVAPAQMPRIKLVHSSTEGSIRGRVCTACCLVGVVIAIALLSSFEGRL